tara:strand:+ start:4985 stop:7651 length:2667 start_codon:yes stop_codon:yes gene_type:complete
MSVLKNTVQVNNGNTGWNAGHVMDAMEEIIGDLGWNSGTQKDGVPQSVRNYNSSGTTADDVTRCTYNYETSGLSSTYYNTAYETAPYRQYKGVYYDVHANGTTAYRLLKKFLIATSEVDETTNTFTEPEHQLSTGDPVVWGYDTYEPTPDVDAIPELTFGTTYYIIKVDNDNFKLAASLSDANSTTEIDISAKGGAGSVPLVQAFSSVTDNNDINVLKGDQIWFYNRTPGIPTHSSLMAAGTGYTATGTDVATTGGSGTGLTVDFTANAGILQSAVINTAGTGYVKGDIVTITTGNGDATFRVDRISGSLGQKFTLCSNTDDYASDKLLRQYTETGGNYYPHTTSHTSWPDDFSGNDLNPPTLDFDGGANQNGLRLDTKYYRQTESNSCTPTELRFPDFNVNDPRENSTQKYIYANDTTPGMTGNIIIHASIRINGSCGEYYSHYDYTVPASGGRGALDLRFYISFSEGYPYYNGGELVGVSILNVAEGWTTGEVFTVPGDQIGGSSPAQDVTFGVAANETSTGAHDAKLEIVTTTIGAGPNFFQKSDNGYFGTVKLENDATKKYGTTYYTFGIHTNADPHTMWISSGSFLHWLNRKGTTGGSNGGSTYGFHAGRKGLDYQYNIQSPSNSDGNWATVEFATSTTPTAYPLKIYSYNAQSPQDGNFAIIQFVQTINEVDHQYGTFYLIKGNQVGSNIFDLDHVWIGCHGEWTSSGRTLLNSMYVPNYHYYTSGASREPAGNYSLAREAFYGYYRDSADNWVDKFEDQYSCNIDTDNDHARNAVTYFRDATYDNLDGYSVSSAADYYRPMKGIPLSRKMMPVPYTFPDDFVLLQVSTSPGLTNFRPGDTITISASEVYEVIRAAWSTNQNSLDGLNDSSSMGLLLLARTT